MIRRAAPVRTAALLACALAAGCTFDLGTDPALRDGAASAPALAPTPEATSLFGQPLFAPDFDDKTRAQLDEQLKHARLDYAKDRGSRERILDLGWCMVDLGMWRGAASMFNEGVSKHPTDAELRDARGVAHLALRELEPAKDDFVYAVGLVEPDSPTDEDGSLAWRTRLHVGVARFVQGDFRGARDDFAAAAAVGANQDERCAAAAWETFACGRLDGGDAAAACRAQDASSGGVDHPWRDVVRMFRDDVTVQSLVPDPPQRAPDAKDVDVPAAPAEIVRRYAAANWFLIAHRRDEAIAQLEWIVKSDRWADPCAVAAEADLHDLSRFPR